MRSGRRPTIQESSVGAAASWALVRAGREVARRIWPPVPLEPRGDRKTSGPRSFRKIAAAREQGVPERCQVGDSVVTDPAETRVKRFRLRARKFNNSNIQGLKSRSQKPLGISLCGLESGRADWSKGTKWSPPRASWGRCRRTSAPDSLPAPQALSDAQATAPRCPATAFTPC